MPFFWFEYIPHLVRLGYCLSSLWFICHEFCNSRYSSTSNLIIVVLYALLKQQPVMNVTSMMWCHIMSHETVFCNINCDAWVMRHDSCVTIYVMRHESCAMSHGPWLKNRDLWTCHPHLYFTHTQCITWYCRMMLLNWDIDTKWDTMMQHSS